LTYFSREKNNGFLSNFGADIGYDGLSRLVKWLY